jgi:hypothetical protein
MSTYFEDIEVIFDQIELKNRDPEFNRQLKMQGFRFTWGLAEFDDVIFNYPKVKTAGWGLDAYDTAMKALWAVLEVKTSGESSDIIEHLSNAEDASKRNGFEAFRRIHKWYTELTGEALEMRRNQFFNPTPPSKEEDVAKAIQKWEYDLRELKALDPSLAHIPTWMFTNALRRFLVGDLRVEIFTQQTRWVGEGRSEDEQYQGMKRYMWNWAAQKSLQARSPKYGNICEWADDSYDWHEEGYDCNEVDWQDWHYEEHVDWYNSPYTDEGQ